MRPTRRAAALAAVFSIGASATAGAATHTVVPGDTLSAIADSYGVGQSVLIALNNISNPNLIRVGQLLQLPASVSSPTPTSTPAPPAPSAKPSTYTIRAGDTLTGIAIGLGVSLTELAQANGISDPNRIYVGEVLVVPGRSSSSNGGTSGGSGGGATSGSSVEHVVLSGETLGGIADNYGVDLGSLASANNISDPNMIRVGQRLAIPSDYTLPVGLFGRSATSPSKLQLVPMFNLWADANAIPRDLVKAVAYHESGWNNSAISSVGAIGIGQIMPDTAVFISEVLIGKKLDSRIPEDNIRMSARYLRYLLEETGWSTDQALASYYQGLSSVRSRGWYDDTKQYVANIQALRPWFQ